MQKTGAKIVVTSTWRLRDDYKEALYRSGLNKNIEILGKTKHLGTKRGKEIQNWLDENKDLNIEKFIILDDDCDMLHLSKFLIKTDGLIGLSYYEYEKALKFLGKIEGE